MSRSLRPRKSNPSYAVPLRFGSEDELMQPEDDDVSSDDFQPVKDQAGEDEAEELQFNDEVDMLDDEIEEDVRPVKQSSKVKPVQKTAEPKHILSKVKVPKKASAQVVASFSRPNNRQQYALPTPSQDHRHQAKPLFFTNSRVERLINRPRPFGPSVVTPTNNYAMLEEISIRYNKASGYNVGPGPLWDFMEDRSWWKESYPRPAGELETEATRRPRVYEDVAVHENLDILDGISSQSYLPIRYDIHGTASSSIKCSLGPIQTQTQRNIRMFESVDMSEFQSEARAHVFNAGGPVWALDWCPIYVEDQPRRHYKQYIAVSPSPSNRHSPKIGVKCENPSPACIQIWSYGPTLGKGKEKAEDDVVGELKCELVICIDCGPAQDLKWCPLPSHDSWASSSHSTRKLGILAGTFEDGSLSIFVVPDPEDLAQEDEDLPISVKLEPTIRLINENTCFWALDWANSERIAVGCTNGCVAVYDIKEPILSKTPSAEILPSYYISLHQSAIRALQWIRVPPVSADGLIQRTSDPTIIATGGFDGCGIYTDLRDLSGNVANRARDTVHSMSYSAYTVGVVTIDQTAVKTHTVNPTMLARGHLLLEAGGPLWSLHCSDYHPHLAVASADGSVVTTNSLKSMRRSVSTPLLSYKIFQMDYNRKTGEYRMLDRFKPSEFYEKPGTKKPSAKNPSTSTEGGTGAWPAEVSATRVSWNNGGGLARAPLLASATSSGLCRIDWLEGMFLRRDREPYGGIQIIRREVDRDDVQTEEEDDD